VRHNYPKAISVVQIRSPQAAGCLLPDQIGLEKATLGSILQRLDLLSCIVAHDRMHATCRRWVQMCKIFQSKKHVYLQLYIAEAAPQSKPYNLTPMPTFSQVNQPHRLARNIRTGTLVRKVRANWLPGRASFIYIS
jgi:hypothetical protein